MEKDKKDKKSVRAVLKEDGFYHLPDGTRMTPQEYRLWERQNQEAGQSLQESKGQKRILLG